MARAAEELICKDKEIAEKDKEIATLEEKIVNLQNEIRQIHQEPFKKRKKEEEEENLGFVKGRGAPKGHRGGGRKKPHKVNRVVDVYTDKCRECSSSNIKIYENMQGRVTYSRGHRIKSKQNNHSFQKILVSL